MDPFEIWNVRRPVPVKGSTTGKDLDFDENLIDRILGTPDKIDIPERYIPEEEQLEPEEERKRSEKAEAICRLLSKSNGAAGIGIPLNPVRLPPAGAAATKKEKSSGEHMYNQHRSRQETVVGTYNSYPRERSYHHNQSSNTAGLSTPASPVKRATSIRKIGAGGGGSASANSSLSNRHSFISSSSSSRLQCDWSLAGVCPPKEVRYVSIRYTFRQLLIFIGSLSN